MPAPRWLAHFNRRVTNQLLVRLAVYLPGFGVVVHTGRKTGRSYRTPVNIFRHGNRYVIALTYGPGADWVRNILASGGCTLITRRRSLRLTLPRLFRDDRRRFMPVIIRPILGLVRVSDFLELTIDAEPAGRTQPG